MSNKVLITNQQKKVKIPSGLRILIRRSCNAVLEFEGFEQPAEISVTFVDNAEIQTLNAQYRGKDMPTDVLSFPLGEDGKYDVEMTFYHRRTGKGDLTDDRDLTAAVKSLRGMDRDVRDKLGRVKLALRYAYAGYYVDVTELDMNPFDGSLPEATRWTERVEN